ncbi:MAG: peroxin [Alyxoria varia]|nr:MAG: peroxin [Alyxoria varia]
MIRATRDWFRRNRYPIAVGAGVLGAGYVAGQYVLGKLNEARQRMSDERIAKEKYGFDCFFTTLAFPWPSQREHSSIFIANNTASRHRSLRRRFAQNQEDCTYTILALLPTAAENINAALPVEQITHELQARRSEKVSKSTASSEPGGGAGGNGSSEVTTGDDSASSSYVRASQVTGDNADREAAGKTNDGKTKMQLWNELKISAITRAFTMIYTLCLLALLTRIQLNLLGRRNYLSSVVSLAQPSPTADDNNISLENRDDEDADAAAVRDYYGSDLNTNRMYLTFSWWLLHRGWAILKQKVETAVAEVFGTLNPRDSISFEHLSQLTIEVRKRVEGATEDERRKHPWLQYLLPPRDQEQAVLKESGIGPIEGHNGQGEFEITRSLRRLLDETSDIIESPTFSHILTLMLDATFSLLVDDRIATQAYKIPAQTTPSPDPQIVPTDDLLQTNPLLSPESRIQEIPETSTTPAAPGTAAVAKQVPCKLATVLAVITRQAHEISLSGDLERIMSGSASNNGVFDMLDGQSAAPSLKDANGYLSAIESVGDLEAFAAVVYSSNFELEGVENLEENETPQESADIDESLVDVARDFEGSLESAWEKAKGALH